MHRREGSWAVQDRVSAAQIETAIDKKNHRGLYALA
jgi:hypothetical protein